MLCINRSRKIDCCHAQQENYYHLFSVIRSARNVVVQQATWRHRLCMLAVDPTQQRRTVNAKFHYAMQLASRELVCDLLVSWIA